MTRKLRLLTVVSLAEQNKLLPYSLLMSELEITTVRELEDLVIEGISGNIFLNTSTEFKSPYPSWSCSWQVRSEEFMF